MVQRYFPIVNILLVTAGIYLCVNAFYTIVTARWYYGLLAAAPTRPMSTVPAGLSAPPLSDYQVIINRNLFKAGGEGPAPMGEKVDIDQLKATELNLKLWGTVTGQSGQAYAVIEDTKSREQNLYRAGDSVQNALVKLILREKVVLRVEERDEILAMEEIHESKRGGRTDSKQMPTTEPEAGPMMPISNYPNKIALKSDQVAKALGNLSQLMEQATLRPHIEDGQPVGISITGIKPDAIYRKMRLRNGDIITGINGNPIGSVEDAVKVFQDLSSGNNIQLQIQRRGREQTLDYTIE
jgi:general secretion pathway protein C